jgi:TRAP-type mannitol/chloroaromatic compound transport system permease small subunit
MHKSIFMLSAVYSLDNEVRFRAKSNLLIPYRPYDFMNVERQMIVDVSVVTLFPFPNVNLLIKNSCTFCLQSGTFYVSCKMSYCCASGCVVCYLY